MEQVRQIIWEINKPFDELWNESGVESAYVPLVKDRIYELVRNLNSYNPQTTRFSEFKASIGMLAYTTTELLAQLCSGGFRWASTDKARFLSPTVNIESIIRVWSEKCGYYHQDIQYDNEVENGVWEFLRVSEETHSWFEAINLDEKQTAYLLWAAKKSLQLLNAEERIPGFTCLALSDETILKAFKKCESPIESILFMQMAVDGLLPPVLENQYQIDNFRVDFAIPQGNVVIECDGAKYHDEESDAIRDMELIKIGWVVLRFSAQNIIKDPAGCSSKIQDQYPWKQIQNRAKNEK